MGAIAAAAADVAIVTSDNPRGEDPLEIIAESCAAPGTGSRSSPTGRGDRPRARAARDGDVVVIAGKGHEPGQQFRDRTLPFDDREAAREALRRLGRRA